jgi:hypothetical protein
MVKRFLACCFAMAARLIAFSHHRRMFRVDGVRIVGCHRIPWHQNQCGRARSEHSKQIASFPHEPTSISKKTLRG